VIVGVLAQTGAFSDDEIQDPPTAGQPPAPDDPPIGGDTITIYSSLPMQGALRSQADAVVRGARRALARTDGRAAGFRVRYVPLDDSLASTGLADDRRTAANARRAADDATAVGYIGEFNSGASRISIPLLNQAGIAQVSPSNTYVGLTIDAPGVEPGEPDRYYPTGRRTFARLVPNDAVQARVLTAVAAEGGCEAIDIWQTGTPYSEGLAEGVEASAVGEGMSVERTVEIDPDAPSYRSQAEAIRSDCLVFAGEFESNGSQALSDVAAAGPPRRVLAGDAMCFDAPARAVPAALVPRFRCTVAVIAPDAYEPAGRAFYRDYARRYDDRSPDPYAIYGYESMALLLDAVERASEAGGGELRRSGVVDALFDTKGRESVLGSYSIDQNGDTTTETYGLYEVDGGRIAFDRVVHP
jgi:branched-chain amino acid transport system substrate-binding protein